MKYCGGHEILLLKSLVVSCFCIICFSQWASGGEDAVTVRLSRTEPIKRLGIDIYLVADGNALIFIPGKNTLK